MTAEVTGTAGTAGTVRRRTPTRLDALPAPAVVAGTLLLLAVAAIALSALGLTGYSPLVLLVDAPVAVVATAVPSALLGRLVRSPAYRTSSVITGLLLFFLLPPTLDPAGLGLLVAACVVAAASKFVLAVRGRHVLNPAAFGAFAVAATGLTGSSWWVASTALTPVLLVAATLVVLRTRLTGPVLAFVLPAAALVVAGQVRAGTEVLPALVTALTSTPIVFLAAFMLTEPITLPRGTGRRLVVAAVVGALVALPYWVALRLGPIAPSPEIALLLGNLLGAVLAVPAAARMRFLGARPLGADVWEYRFTPERSLHHEAGQYLELQVPHERPDRRGIRRTLSIVSPPGAADVRVAVRSPAGRSSFKQALADLREGGEVRAVTVGGAFTLPRRRDRPLLLVASGIGITPFVSQLQAEAADRAAGRPPRDVTLVYRVRSAVEVPYRDELSATGVPVVLVAPDATVLPPGWSAESDLEAALRTRAADRTASVSGTPSFVSRTRRLLRAAGARAIRTDAFAGA